MNSETLWIISMAFVVVATFVKLGTVLWNKMERHVARELNRPDLPINPGWGSEQ